jgi:hypothetical protein
MPIIYLVQGAIYLTGIVEGAYKYILPAIRSIYSIHNKSYAEVFAGLFVIVCAFTIFLTFFGIDVPFISTSSILSDVGFLAGGLMVYAIKLVIKKKKMKFSKNVTLNLR